MSILSRFSTQLSLAVIISTGLPTLSYAQQSVTPEQLTSTLQKWAEKRGQKLTVGLSSSTNNEIVLKDVELQAEADNNPNESMRVSEVHFSGVSQDNGTLKAEKIIFKPIEANLDEGRKINIKGLEIDNLSTDLNNGDNTLFAASTIDDISLLAENKTIAVATNINAALTDDSADSQVTVEHFMVEPKAVLPSFAYSTFQELGYDKLQGSMSGVLNFQSTTGAINLRQSKLQLDNIGELNLQTSLAMTNEFKERYIKSNGKVFPSPHDLTFSELTLNFSDASLTNRVLDYISTKNGQSRKQLTDQIKAFLPFIGMKIPNTQFVGQLTGAVNSYLDDPKNITIHAKSKTPILFSDIEKQTRGKPEKLVEILDIEFKANQ